MTVAEKLAFAVTWPVIAPILLGVFLLILVAAYPAILILGTVSHEGKTNH